MKQYIGTKIISAEREDTEAGAGYLVEYADGYQSWSPKAAFDEAYQPMDGGLSFGHALVLLKQGKRVERAGWNGKGMFIYLVGPSNYPATSEVAKNEWGADALVPYSPYLAIKSVNGIVSPWAASQTDVLADDWIVN